MNTKLIILASAVAFANAATITETLNTVLPEQCKSECTAWYTNVGDCMSNTGGNFSASVSLSDLSTAQFSGDLSPLGSCLCSAEAVQASSTCLSCISNGLCIEPALTMQDYSQVCTDPLVNGMALFSRYHEKLSMCTASSTSSSTAEPTSSSTAEPTTTPPLLGSGGDSTSTPCPASTGSPCTTCSHHKGPKRGGYRRM